MDKPPELDSGLKYFEVNFLKLNFVKIQFMVSFFFLNAVNEMLTK